MHQILLRVRKSVKYKGLLEDSSNIKDEIAAFFNKDEGEMTSTDPIEEPEDEDEDPEEIKEVLDPKPTKIKML